MDSNYHRVPPTDAVGSDLSAMSDRKALFPGEYGDYAQSESSNETLCNNEDVEDLRHDGRPRAPVATSRWIWLAHAMLLAASISFWTRGMLYAHPSTAKFVEDFSTYSSAAGAVEYVDIKFDGNFSAISPYVGANSAVDAAWQRITYDIGDQMISAVELRKIGKSPDVLKVTDPKTGIEGYRVGLEVFHQLHCLNLLRKYTFYEHYEKIDGDFEEGKGGLRMHLDHCLEILRMNLQCQSDIGLITFREMPGLDGPWPDFSTWHTCRKFEKVREWAIENTVSHDDAF